MYKNTSNKYECTMAAGTADRIASRQPTDATAYAYVCSARWTMHVHSPDESTFLCEIIS